jgi:hypothetical protein
MQATGGLETMQASLSPAVSARDPRKVVNTRGLRGGSKGGVGQSHGSPIDARVCMTVHPRAMQVG